MERHLAGALVIMDMKFFRRKKLATLVALGMLAITNSSAAMEREYIEYDGKQVAELQILSATDVAKAYISKNKGTGYDLSSMMVTGIKSATSYWIDMIGAGLKNPQPWQIAVYGLENLSNAYASTTSYPRTDETEIILGENGVNLVKKALQNGRVLHTIDDFSMEDNPFSGTSTADVGYSTIAVGRYLGAKSATAPDGYSVDNETVLPTNEQAVDMVSVFRHELAHALGMSMNAKVAVLNVPIDVADDDIWFPYPPTEQYMVMSAQSSSPTDWNSHLIDQNGNRLDGYRYVISTTYELDKINKARSITSEFNPIKAPDLTINDVFYVETTMTEGTTQGKAYFVGDNVSEVLGAATFDGVSGIPINTWEDGYVRNNFEGSHLDIPGLMSHRNYRNYSTFMELELAVMQDIGYTIDRKAYYGYSVYDNNSTITNNQGYFARNEDGTDYVNGEFSAVPLGIGLHVYGYNNIVTQAADILTQGTGSVGVRMDGYGNTLNIADGTTISADGKRGMGLLVCYGRNQVVNQSGTVTAMGSGGRATVFNFGSNSVGAGGEYRGSYIRFARSIDANTGNITASSNPKLTDMGYRTYSYTADELAGALVDEYNLSGTLKGSDAAIYIAKNAFVKNININSGASIEGDIVSEWKHFATDGSYDAAGVSMESETASDNEPLKIQYNGKSYDYTDYIPDLVTKLNVNTELSYTGTISGYDNMELNVNSGTLNYSGKADVINVTVADGASVVGGTYTVNSMASAATADSAQAAENTGIFYNHGTISSGGADNPLVINGNLVSDGTLYVASADGAAITVNGNATVDGSTVSVADTLAAELPGKNITVLEATGIVSGELTNGSVATATPIAPMLGCYAAVNDNSVNVQTVAQNNLGELTPAETAGYEAVSTIATELAGDSRTEVLRPLYSMTADAAKESLGRVATNDLPGDIAMSTQRSQLTNRLVANRLHSLWKTPALSQLNTPNIMSGAGFARRAALDFSSELTLPVSGAVVADNVALRTAPPEIDSNTWVNITKNWGELAGDANYHGQAISAGYDWASGQNSRSGVFVSYRASSLGAGSSSASLYDMRLGYYTGSQHGAVECALYADVGWLYSKTARYLYGDLTARGKESSNLYELGGRIGYDLHHADGRLWHVVPYLAAQGSWLRSRGYTETGAGVLNQQVASDTSRYFGAQLGVSLERPIRNGSLTIDLGLRHAFSGGEVYRSYRYEGANGRSFTMSSSQDTTHGLLSITADTEFARGWHVSASGTLERGAHDRDISASLALKRMW